MKHAPLTTLGNPFVAEDILLGDEVIRAPGTIKPVFGVGSNRCRVRIRLGEFVRAYLRSGSTVTEHHVVNMGDHWELLPAVAINYHAP